MTSTCWWVGVQTFVAVQCLAWCVRLAALLVAQREMCKTDVLQAGLRSSWWTSTQVSLLSVRAAVTVNSSSCDAAATTQCDDLQCVGAVRASGSKLGVGVSPLVQVFVAPCVER